MHLPQKSRSFWARSVIGLRKRASDLGILPSSILIIIGEEITKAEALKD
jgi:hypothetical protein